MAGRVPSVQQCRLGFTFSLTGSILTTAVHAAVAAPPLLLQQVLLTVIAVGCADGGLPYCLLRMLDLFPKARGSAASVQSCVSIVISAIVFGALAPLASGSMLNLSEASLCAALIGFALWASRATSGIVRPSAFLSDP